MKPQKPYPVSVAFGSVRWITTKVADALLLYVLLMRNYQKLTLGTYTVKGLIYDEAKGGFYRDYRNDGLSFHFMAENGGKKTMDGIYSFNDTKDNNILVKYNGSQVADIVNTFQMGAMPFAIVSKFNTQTTGIASVNSNRKNNGKMYNLQGQVVGESYKGIVIINGKKIQKK